MWVNMGMDGKILGRDISLWIDTTEKTNFPTLESDTTCDVVIIGGGIVGISAAYFLAQEDLKIILIDKQKIITKTTGNTTAKITSLHSTIYADLIKNFNEEIAGLYGQANQTGLELIAKIVEEKNFQCDFGRQSAITFAASESDKRVIEDEFQAAKKLGLPVNFLEELDIPISSYGAVEFTSQAQFHPRKYLLQMIKILQQKGIEIYENTKAIGMKDGKIITESANINAKVIIQASHLPFFEKEKFKANLSRFRDYVTAVKIKNELPDGMFISTGSNYHSFRTQTLDDAVLIIDGEGHEIGEDEETDQKRFLNLQKWALENFEIEEFVYYWSTYDWGTKNKIPMAGLYKENIYLATGFGGWGMSNGTICAKLISDLILGKENSFESLYKIKL